jgi:hypothetical protein
MLISNAESVAKTQRASITAKIASGYSSTGGIEPMLTTEPYESVLLYVCWLIAVLIKVEISVSVKYL